MDTQEIQECREGPTTDLRLRLRTSQSRLARNARGASRRSGRATTRTSGHLAYELGRDLALERDVEKLFSLGVSRCRELLNAEGVAVLLLDRDHNELFFPYVAQEASAVAARLAQIRFPADHGFAGHALRIGTPLRSDDVSADGRFFSGVDRGSGLRTRALLCAPLLCAQGALGVMEAVNPCDGGRFSDGDLALLDAVAQTLAQAIDGTLHPALPATKPEETTVFRKEGDYWLIAYEGRSFRLRDAKGLAHIAYLLQHPDQEVHAIELVRNVAPRRTTPHVEPETRDRGPGNTALGDSGPLLDVQARAAYKERLEQLREELEEAAAFDDTGRAEHAKEEIQFLTRELSRAVGLSGRERRAGSPAERARVNVTRAIGIVLKKVAENHPGLALHFARTIKTGTFCSYAPDPRAPIDWVVEPERQAAADFNVRRAG